MYSCTVAQLHSCTVAQLHSCTVAQLHSCTVAQLRRGRHLVVSTFITKASSYHRIIVLLFLSVKFHKWFLIKSMIESTIVIVLKITDRVNIYIVSNF